MQTYFYYETTSSNAFERLPRAKCQSYINVKPCWFSMGGKHESWRGDNEVDHVPNVRKRDGTVGDIDKTRGFVDYYCTPEPYRDPMQRVLDWKEINF